MKNNIKKYLLIIALVLGLANQTNAQMFVGTEGLIIPPFDQQLATGLGPLWGGGQSLNSSMVGWGGYTAGYGAYCSIPGFVPASCFGTPSMQRNTIIQPNAGMYMSPPGQKRMR